MKQFFNKHFKYFAVLIVVAVFLLMGLFSELVKSNSASADSYTPTTRGAALACQEVVQKQLKAPSTASFELSSDANVEYRDQVYFVKSWVDSENSFGAMLRTRYQCIIKPVGDGYWELVDLKIYD